MSRPVGPSDFEIGDDGVFHVPTGAMFWADPESTKPYSITWGTAGEPEAGAEGEHEPMYDRSDVEAVAFDLLQKRATEAVRSQWEV